jgi:hypothetical protein
LWKCGDHRVLAAVDQLQHDLLPFLEFCTEFGDVPDVVPDDIAAGPGRGSGGGRAYSGWPESDRQSSSDG